MLGPLTRSVLARNAAFIRNQHVRRISASEGREFPAISGNLVLLIGTALATGCGAFVHFSGLIIWGEMPDKVKAMKDY